MKTKRWFKAKSIDELNSKQEDTILEMYREDQWK